MNTIVLNPVKTVTNVLLGNQTGRYAITYMFARDHQYTVRVSPRRFAAFRFTTPTKSSIRDVQTRTTGLMRVTRTRRATRGRTMTGTTAITRALLGLGRLCSTKILARRRCTKGQRGLVRGLWLRCGGVPLSCHWCSDKGMVPRPKLVAFVKVTRDQPAF